MINQDEIENRKFMFARTWIQRAIKHWNLANTNKWDAKVLWNETDYAEGEHGMMYCGINEVLECCSVR